MENKIKNIIGSGPEYLFDSITSAFTDVIKYAVLFDDKDYFHESYLKSINEQYERLIRYCRSFLSNLYRKEIENIFPEEVEALNEETDNNNIKKTVEITTTWKPAGTETDNDEETETDNDEETETDNNEETENL